MTSKESTNPSTTSGPTAATNVFDTAAAAMNPAFDIDVWQGGGGGKGKPLPFQQSCYALYWNDLPSLVISKHEVKVSDTTRDEKKTTEAETRNSKTILILDGYSFEGRMATYKYVIEHSMCNIAVPTCTSKEDPSKEAKMVWGDRLERHFFWGYAALLDWEYRSGRLAYSGTGKGATDNDKTTKTSIATDSWWGYMNFCYSICVLLGAHEAGVLDPSIERIQLSDEFSNHLVRTDPVIRKTIKEWSIFWKQVVTPFVKQTLKLQTTSSTTKIPFDDPQHERLYDAMNEHEWMVHSYVFQWTVFDKATSEKSLPRRLLRELPEPERKFCVGFCKAVDLFAALNWRTDLTITLENGAGFMPLEVLENAENYSQTTAPPSCSKMEERRRKTVIEMHNLCDTSDEGIQTMASVWKRVGRWHSVRRNMGSMIKDLSHGSTTPANAWEASLWVGAAAATTAGLFLSRGSHRTKS